MIRRHPILARMLFMLPAVLVAVPMMMILVWIYRAVEPTEIVFVAISGSLIAFLLCLVPGVHRFERLVASKLLGTEVDREAGSRTYRNSAVFALLHLLAGLSALLCLISVPIAISELSWRTERVLEWSLSWSDAIENYLEIVTWSEIRIILAMILFVSAIWATTFLCCLPMVARQLLGPNLEKQLAESEADRERLEAQNDLARDIHDSLGHTLTIASLQAERGRVALADDPRSADDALSTILLVCRRAQADLDDVLRVLRTGEASTLKQARDLRSIGDLIDDARSAGLLVDVDVPLNLEISADRSQALYRIVQEALTNALRYASPRELSLTITDDDRGLRVLTTNPVFGAVHHRDGRGLHGIEARARLLGGSASSQIIADHFILDVRIPARHVEISA
ncbi:histidine kinase [Brevibacterium ammoniilyticum]|uniref:histidine kinase n=1 Tax=Brevibacterium ammoniilyticum TaxID=1046555 RepID=A0ABP9U0D2_9MICO